MIVYVTKYALTKGIQRVEVKTCENCPNMVEVRNGSYSCFYHKPNWHETEAEALVQAEKIRKRKIASVKKQLQKLEGIKFTIPTDSPK